MLVQTVEWGNAYGSHTDTVCRDCSGTLYIQMSDNLSGRYNARNDWRDGTCAQHVERQALTKIMARNMGAC